MTVKLMKQECSLVVVWLTWVFLPALSVVAGVRRGWAVGALVLLVGVLAQMIYLRWFPRLSRLLGYGSVADVPPRLPAVPAHLKVTLYTANGCPFCPIVRQRLDALRGAMGIDLQEIDVTFRPELVREKGFRAVPVVEVGGRFLVGNATSAELADFVAGVTPPSRSLALV